MNSRIRIFLAGLLTALLLFCFWSGSCAEVLSAQLHYAGLDKQEHSCPVTLDEAWFGQDNQVYNHELATATLKLAMAGFRASKLDYAATDRNIRSLYSDLGFTDYQAEQYNRKPEPDTISTAMAMRTMEDEKGPFTLIAVCVCGQGYGNEWVSNFTVGNEYQHAGFSHAASLVYERIRHYIAEHVPQGRVKLWMGGFSRSSAVSNLTADMVLTNGDIPADSVYVYTFATPNCTTKPVAWPQIFNIVNTTDVVPKVPLSVWGYGKHGTTLYLPCRENTLNYGELENGAREFFISQQMNPDAFGSADDRDWLLSQVLKLLGGYLPKAENTDGIQQAASVALLTEGTLLDKLQAMVGVLQGYVDTDEMRGLSAIMSEGLPDLLGRGANDSLNELAGGQNGTGWLSLVSSGIDVVYEHQPVIYLAWMASADQYEDLFSHSQGFHQLSWTGDLDSRVLLMGENGEETLWFDSITGKGNASHLQLGNQTFVNLPMGQTWQIILNAPEDTVCQVSWEMEDPCIQIDTSMRTAQLHVYSGETLTMAIPAEATDESGIQLTLDNGTQIGMDPAMALTTAGRSRRSVAEQYLTGMIVMIPYLLLGLITLIYAITVGVLRLKHGGSLKDDVSINRIGCVLLVLSAMLCLAMAVRHGLGVIDSWNHGYAHITNRTMLRVSEYIGWGMRGYEITCVILYLMFGSMSLMSIRRGLERIRLLRFSVLLSLVNFIEFGVSVYISTFTVQQLIVMFIPCIAMTGVWLGRDRNDLTRARNRLLFPIRVGFSCTLLLFLARQALLFWAADVTMGSAVILKCLTGLPAVLIALRVYKRSRNDLHRYTLIALCVCMAADMSINLNTYVGMGFFAVSHVLLILSFRGHKLPSRKEIGATVLIWLTLLGLTLWIGRWLPVGMAVPCLLFACLTAFMLVSSFRCSGRVSFAALLMAFADVMVALKIAFPGNPLLDFSELMQYYLGIYILAADGKALIPPQLMPTYERGRHAQEKG